MATKCVFDSRLGTHFWRNLFPWAGVRGASRGGFVQVLEAIAKLWKNDQASAKAGAKDIVGQLREFVCPHTAGVLTSRPRKMPRRMTSTLRKALKRH